MSINRKMSLVKIQSPQVAFDRFEDRSWYICCDRGLVITELSEGNSHWTKWTCKGKGNCPTQQLQCACIVSFIDRKTQIVSQKLSASRVWHLIVSRYHCLSLYRRFGCTLGFQIFKQNDSTPFERVSSVLPQYIVIPIAVLLVASPPSRKLVNVRWASVWLGRDACRVRYRIGVIPWYSALQTLRRPLFFQVVLVDTPLRSVQIL